MSLCMDDDDDDDDDDDGKIYDTVIIIFVT